MTLQQIEKIKATISKLENLKTKPTPTDISRVDSSLENFFHELYKSPYLNISNYFAYDMEITKEQMLADIDDIVSVLNGMLALDPKAAQISDVLELIFEGELASLKRFKDDVKEVNAGYECGLVFEKFNDIKEEDQVEIYIMEEVPR